MTLRALANARWPVRRQHCLLGLMKKMMTALTVPLLTATLRSGVADMVLAGLKEADHPEP